MERLARSLGRLLQLGGMDRYAAMCVSPTTVQILRTYAREGDDAARPPTSRRWRPRECSRPTCPNCSGA
ncbi:hypothetical protein ACFQ0B_18255 [Nonomuraea thailandensis]